MLGLISGVHGWAAELRGMQVLRAASLGMPAPLSASELLQRVRKSPSKTDSPYVIDGENGQVQQQQLGEPRDKGILHFWVLGSLRRCGYFWILLFQTSALPQLRCSLGWL